MSRAAPTDLRTQWLREWALAQPPVKGQKVRLLDVFLLGPAMMIAGGAAYKRGYRVSGGITLAGGFATIVYNAINYGRIEERRMLAKHYGLNIEKLSPGLPGYDAPATFVQ